MSYADTQDLGPTDTGLCKPCIEGACHWEPGWRADLAEALRVACHCPRHRVSMYARGYCLAYAPRGSFPFVAVCRRARGHSTPVHCDTWREVTW